MRVWFASILLLLMACGGPSHQQQAKVVDSLSNAIRQLEKDFVSSAADSARLSEISNEARQKLVFFPKVYQPDSIDVDVILMMQAYRPFATVAARYNIQRQRISTEIPYTLKQLQSLLTDLNNRALKRRDAKKYVDDEKQAAKRLVDSYGFLKAETAATIRKFDSLNVYVRTLIDSLQNDSANIRAIRLKMLKAKTKRRK